MFRLCPNCQKPRGISFKGSYIYHAVRDDARYGEIPSRLAHFLVGICNMYTYYSSGYLWYPSYVFSTLLRRCMLIGSSAILNGSIDKIQGNIDTFRHESITLIQDGYFKNPENINDLGDHLIVQGLEDSVTYDIDKVIERSSKPVRYMVWLLYNIQATEQLPKFKDILTHAMICLGRHNPNIYDRDKRILGLRNHGSYFNFALNYEVATRRIKLSDAQEIFVKYRVCPKCNPEKFYDPETITPEQAQIVLEDLV